MSEQKQSSFMQELDRWTEATVIGPVQEATQNFEAEQDPQEWEKVTSAVKRAIRNKVLDSYRNGQQAGPRPAKGGKRA
jgi:hypothetical protein